MSRSSWLACQIAATAAGAFLDYFVGRLTNRLSVGIAVWAAVTLLASVILEYIKNYSNERPATSGSGDWSTSGVSREPWIVVMRRRHPQGGWGSIMDALKVAGLTAIACYIFALGAISLRFVDQHNAIKLGAKSPYDASFVTSVASIQCSSTTMILIGASFLLAATLRPSVMLPLGVGAASIINAFSLPLAQPSTQVNQPTSQFIESLSQPDAWFFRIPQDAVPWSCLGLLVLGIVLCDWAHKAIYRR
jgi:hypothetical protein